MQATGGTRKGAKGAKRAVKVEEDVSPVPLKKQRQSQRKGDTFRKSPKSEGTNASVNHYRILPYMQKNPKVLSFPNPDPHADEGMCPLTKFSFQTTPPGFSDSSSSSTTNLASGDVQSARQALFEATASPAYTYFTWNSHALPGSYPREKEKKTDLKMELQKEVQRCTSSTSPSASVSTVFESTPFMNTPTAQTQIPGQAHSQASPPSALHQRLEVQLEQRHATLLTHINARYAYILEDDRRRHAAYQEAAFQRAMEIDVEERWGRELSHLIGLTSPALSMTASTSSSPSHSKPHAAQAHSPSFIEIQRDRDYLQLLITNTDMHISALKDAHRVAYEREMIEAQLSARALRELEVRREALVLRRAQEMRCATGPGDRPVPEVGSVGRAKCTKVDCLGCSKDGCVSKAVTAVRERVPEVARRINVLNGA